MAGEVQSFGAPKETRQFKAHGKLELVALRDGLAGRSERAHLLSVRSVHGCGRRWA